MSSPIKLCIATPCYGDATFIEYTTSLIRTIDYMQKRGVTVNIQFVVHESLITRGRNNLVAKFMATDCTHLMFIDADIGWNPEDIHKMIAFNKDIVGGIYPKKALHFEKLNEEIVANRASLLKEKGANRDQYEQELTPFLLNYVLDIAEPNQEAYNDFEKVKYVGTGFMLVKREVIEKMIEKHKDTKNWHPQLDANTNQWSYALFDCAIKDQVYLSEDFLFCQRWLDMGGEIYAYMKSKLVHVGLYRYSGNVEKRLFG